MAEASAPFGAVSKPGIVVVIPLIVKLLTRRTAPVLRSKSLSRTEPVMGLSSVPGMSSLVVKGASLTCSVSVLVAVAAPSLTTYWMTGTEAL